MTYPVVKCNECGCLTFTTYRTIKEYYRNNNGILSPNPDLDEDLGIDEVMHCAQCDIEYSLTEFKEVK